MKDQNHFFRSILHYREKLDRNFFSTIVNLISKNTRSTPTIEFSFNHRPELSLVQQGKKIAAEVEFSIISKSDCRQCAASYRRTRAQDSQENKL